MARGTKKAKGPASSLAITLRAAHVAAHRIESESDDERAEREWAECRGWIGRAAGIPAGEVHMLPLPNHAVESRDALARYVDTMLATGLEMAQQSSADGDVVRAIEEAQRASESAQRRERPASSAADLIAEYRRYVDRKLVRVPPTGIESFDARTLSASLFPHQRDLITWAFKRGRAAIFADTGLGKTRMQLEWARIVAAHTGGRVLIVAPLAVAAQTIAEGATLGITVTLVREHDDVREGINIINYDRLHKIDPAAFVAVVLDESSIIKHHDAKTLAMLLEAFGAHAWKLCLTATPAPNDFVELGTHAEFLGVCTRAEMLSEYFVHDGGETQKWRLKGHARAAFWEWVASWAALVRAPSDLGHDDSRYMLPALHTHEHLQAADAKAVREAGLLFAMPAKTLSERRDARKGSLSQRVEACAELVNASDEPWIVWCELNDESKALTKSIRDAVEVTGSMSSEEKERALEDFSRRGARVLVSKPSICGFGLNWQHCRNIAFVGVTDSWEAYYQAIRRCWRFGQTREVHVHVFASELEGNVVANLKRKDADARVLAEELSRWTRDAVAREVHGAVRSTNSYAPREALIVPSWLREVA